MSDFVVSRVPWGLVSLDSGDAVDIDERGLSCSMSSGLGAMLFTSDNQVPVVDGKPGEVKIHTNIGIRKNGELVPNDRIRKNMKLVPYDLPVPLRDGMEQTILRPRTSQSIKFTWSDLLSRPPRKDVVRPELNQDRNVQQFHFLLALVGRMQDFDTSFYDGHNILPWDTVLERWLNPEEEQDPRMDVLVRHAKQYRGRWVEITENPRRLLNRTRELVALSRVEEVDTHCMAWLSRQPGHTIPERAGPRQRILALARYENLNTLENRVFRDLLERSAVAARDYLEQNRGRRIKRDSHGRTSRYFLVDHYARECRRLSRDLAQLGIKSLESTVQPNFVLLQDSRYRHVWSAWQEIVKRETTYDDLWRWQRLAWAEFVKVSCAVSLQAIAGGELYAASPLSLQAEHEQGEWLRHDDPLVLIGFLKQNIVVEVLDGRKGDLAKGLSALGASALIRFSDLEGGMNKYIAVWSILEMNNKADIDKLARSANGAIEHMRKFHPQARLTGGLVLVAKTDPEVETKLLCYGDVAGLCFGPFDKQLPEALEKLGDKILDLVKAAL